MAERMVVVAAVTGAHGVHGRVRLKTFTEVPADVAAYGPLSEESGPRTFSLRVTGSTRDGVIAEIEGIRSREAAEALRGLRLCVGRERLPEPEDEEEFYHADLVGLVAVTPEGQRLGTVRAIHDFGAGDVLDIKPSKGAGLLLPFTREVAPEVDVAGGTITIVVPDEIEVHDEVDEEAEQ